MKVRKMTKISIRISQMIMIRKMTQIMKSKNLTQRKKQRKLQARRTNWLELNVQRKLIADLRKRNKRRVELENSLKIRPMKQVTMNSLITRMSVKLEVAMKANTTNQISLREDLTTPRQYRGSKKKPKVVFSIKRSEKMISTIMIKKWRMKRVVMHYSLAKTILFFGK
jgi:hypothetical protein